MIELYKHQPYVPPSEAELRALRAQRFAESATRLERRAAELLKEAKDYRLAAERLNSTNASIG